MILFFRKAQAAKPTGTQNKVSAPYRKENTLNNIVIIGTGPAGLTAAIYAARAGLAPVLYAGRQHGGQLTTTTEVENFPGFAHGIAGPKLMSEMTEQATRVGANIIYDEITGVDFSKETFVLETSDGKVEAKAVIISTGATAKTLGLPGESDLMGKGLSTCATCDGFFYRNKKVVVIGGGDSAMEEALYLSNLCSEVILIHRRDEFRASKIMVDRVKSSKIKLMTPYNTLSLLSDKTGVTGVLVENVQDGLKEEVKCDGLFYAIGHQPNSAIFADYVDLDDHGYIKVKNFTETRTPGIFAAGDIADPIFKQAITAAGMGCQAAISAAKYLEAKHFAKKA